MNYRVVRGRTAYRIHEVYYDDKDQVIFMTETAVAPEGESLEDLRQELNRMLAACDKAVLED